MGINNQKRMFLVIESGSNNNPKQDDLHPCPFGDITMLLRKQGRGVAHPGPTIMLKLYFARHTFTVGIVWEVGGGGVWVIFLCISCLLFLRRKNSGKENTWRKKFQKNMSQKKIYHLPEVRGEKILPKPNHPYSLKSQTVGSL